MVASFSRCRTCSRTLFSRRFTTASPEAAAEIWKQMSVHRFWQLLMSDAIDAYYAHPWAWDEIGFGGPPIRAPTCGWNAASPSRGKWKSSATTGLAPAMLSPTRSTPSHHHTEAGQHSHHGSGGTH